jgi:tetratricopeptide (TPR) repeat protein
MGKQKKQERQQPQQPPKAKAPDNKLSLILGLIIAALGFLLYANTLNHEYALDDYSVLRENNIVMRGTEAIPTIFKTSYRYGYYNLEDGLYRPLSLAMFATEWEIAPDKPALSHWVNVLLYAFTGLVLFNVLRKVFSRYSIVFPFLVALLFIAHPIHTEVVANIKSRDEILCFLFALLSLNSLLTATATFQLADESRHKLNAPQLALSALFFFTALLSKESTITMLAGFPLILWFFTPVKPKQIALSVLPLVGATALYMIIRFTVLNGKLNDSSVTTLDNFLVAAPDFGIRFATALKVLGLYLKLLVVPQPLLYDYSFNKIPLATYTDLTFIISLVLHLALGIFALWQLPKKNPLSFAILFYFITIVLFSNIFIIIGVGMAERLMYFPSVAFCIAMVYLLLLATGTNKDSQAFTSVGQFAAANSKALGILTVVVVLFSVKTVARNPAWKNNYTLYTTDLPQLKESTRAHYYLGNEIIKSQAPAEKDPVKQKQLFAEGIGLLNQSLAIYPGYSEALSQLGVGYYKIADYANAVKYSEQARKLNPNDIITLNNLGSAYFQTNRYKEALELYERVIAINPRYEDGWMNLGSINGMTGNYDKAISCFQQVLGINPNNARALYYIGVTYQNKGDNVLAQQYIQKAKQIDPGLK